MRATNNQILTCRDLAGNVGPPSFLYERRCAWFICIYFVLLACTDEEARLCKMGQTCYPAADYGDSQEQRMRCV